MKKHSRLFAAIMTVALVFNVAFAMSYNTSAADIDVATVSSSQVTSVRDYSTFIECLKTLEGYAESYVKENPNEEQLKLVLNFIRTGVSRYQSSSWQILAGYEKTAFVDYVKALDEENGTSAGALRSLRTFRIPNGNIVDFGHLSGSLDLAYSGNGNVVFDRADLGSWAGDVCDLICVVRDDPNAQGDDIDAIADYIRLNKLGYEQYDGPSFSLTDIYGDLDAFYITANLKGNSNVVLSELMESYFTEELTDYARVSFFLENRFDGACKKDDIRMMSYKLYKANTLINVLETSYDLGTCENLDTLRECSCYAFADYLYSVAGNEDGPGIGGTEPSTEPPTEPSTEPSTEPENPANEFYSVFSNNHSVVVPGVSQDITYAITADEKQIVYYTATIDINRDDISICANYNNNDASSWALARVSDQMAYAQAKYSNPNDPANYIENYNIVLGTNADFYNMSTGEPTGALVIGGVKYHGDNNNVFFAILKDGTPVIGDRGEYSKYASQIQEAVGGSSVLVKNGEICDYANSSDFYTKRASRTSVGITEDGQVVLMVLDGRQEPFSAGGSLREVAQIMYEAGCVTAINLDGGGSSTFVSKQEGTDDLSVINRPSDGYERSVSSSLIVVSTASVSSEFDHAIISSEADYLTVGASVTLSAIGVSSTGNSANIPEDVEWELSDTTRGYIENGKFFATKNGTTTVNLVAGSEIVGSKTISVVMPDEIRFEKSSIDAIYGESTAIPVSAYYKDNYVKTEAGNFSVELSNVTAGTMDGLNFIGNEESGIRNVNITVSLAKDLSVNNIIRVALYCKDEAVFDFDNADGGNRLISWNRDVSNSVLDSNDYDYCKIYCVDVPGENMETSYTFGMDLREAPIPEELIPLVSYIAGGDVVGVTAWDLMLQLAERIGSMTNVTCVVRFDKNMVVDYSDLKVVNDYFTLESAALDEDTNILTLSINWIKQSQAIPAESANPIVILSGIKLTPKDDADWNSTNRISVVNSGEIYYDIYLRAGLLYSMSGDPAFQQQYGIYPYANPNDSNDRGGHFNNLCSTFNDNYILDNTVKQGWRYFQSELRYFVNNVTLTGIQQLPGFEGSQDGLYYDLGETGICVGPLSGLFEKDGDLYYAVNGELRSSWRIITDDEGNDQYYYFNRQTYKAVDGEQTISGYTYVFKDHVLTKGCWLRDDEGIRYVWAGKVKCNEWFNVDGNLYFAYTDYHLATGIAKTLNYERTREEIFVFDENGIWLRELSGFYDYDGGTYLVDNGVRVAYPGLVQVGDDFYYFKSNHTMVKGSSYYISKTNGLIPQGTYSFDSDGKLIKPEAQKNGIVKEADGTWYYYKDGKKFYAGLIEIDGDYYYVTSSFKVIHDGSYFVSKNNGLMPQGTYSFDLDGKLIIPDEPKNGIDKEADGTWYYYKDGKKFYAGLIEIDGDYYYVTSSFKVIHDGSYFVSKNNGLMPQGTYSFDLDGKLIIPDEPKNGIDKEADGTWYYYKDGKKFYAGLIEIDGDYYYVTSSFKVIHDGSYFVSKNNGLMPQGTYKFDSDGKMILG